MACFRRHTHVYSIVLNIMMRLTFLGFSIDHERLHPPPMLGVLCCDMDHERLHPPPAIKQLNLSLETDHERLHPPPTFKQHNQLTSRKLNERYFKQVFHRGILTLRKDNATLLNGGFCRLEVAV